MCSITWCDSFFPCATIGLHTAEGKQIDYFQISFYIIYLHLLCFIKYHVKLVCIVQLLKIQFHDIYLKFEANS